MLYMPEMPSSQIQPESGDALAGILETAETIILGKHRELRLALACMLAGGHLLIEDMPGIGKTTLALTFARLLGLDYQRIQFTADLLPADVVGVSIYESKSGGAGAFSFHPGPVFTNLLLADEINRASPKAQSALLEAMEEEQVTVEGATRPLPRPFFVIATQNPSTQHGTFPLPESQLDRFLMRIRLGYPSASAERDLLGGRERRTLLENIPPMMTPEQARDAQIQATQVHTSDSLLEYILKLVRRTRDSDRYHVGLSPRAGLGLRRAAQAWALLGGREYALPEDVQAIFSAVAMHRLRPAGAEAEFDRDQAAHELIRSVTVD